MAIVGTMPDHSIALVRRAIFHTPVATLQTVDIATAGDPVRLIAIAPHEQVVGLGVRDVALDVASMVQQIVMRRRLPLFVQFGCPVVEVLRPADEWACGNGCIRVKGRKKQLPVEAIHSSAEPYHAIENVLTLEKLFEPGELSGLKFCGAWLPWVVRRALACDVELAGVYIGDQIGAPRCPRSDGMTFPSMSVTP